MALNFSSISDVQIFNLIKRYGDHNFQNQKWIQKSKGILSPSPVFSRVIVKNLEIYIFRF